MENQWFTYHASTKDNPPSQTAVLAAKQFGEMRGQVIDLGCGAGMDVMYFLQKGWKVLAIDAHTEYLSAVRVEMPTELQHNLEIQEMTFEQLHIEQPADCIIANFSLPFCNPKAFGTMWTKIVHGIKQGGVFSGVFFGNRDDWAKCMYEERTFHTAMQVEKLFHDFAIITMDEEEWDGTCCGEDGQPQPKHWHIFRVVARK